MISLLPLATGRWRMASACRACLRSKTSSPILSFGRSAKSSLTQTIFPILPGRSSFPTKQPPRHQVRKKRNSSGEGRGGK
jgi:hypothetical protein